MSKVPHLVALAIVCCLATNMRPARAENLLQAWSVALSLDQSVEASRWQSSAAQRGLYAARAARFPELTTKASYNVYDNPITYVAPVLLPTGNIARFDITQREALLADVTARQPLYTGGRIRGAMDAAGAQVTAAVSNEEKTTLDVMLNVATRYTNVLHAQRHVEVTEQAVESLTSHAREVKNRLDQGVGIRNDLLASQVALSNAQQQNLQADATLDVAKAAYNRALQRPLDAAVTIEDLREPLGSYDIEHLTQQALARRPEIAELSANVRALRSQADVVRASYKPQIAVEGGFQFIENRFLDNESFNRVAVVGEWNLFDMGRKRHSAAKLDQSAEAVLRQRNDVETKIALQVRDAWRRLETARERVRVSRATIENAEENLKVARNRYSQGVGTNTVVLDAETLRTQTYSNYYSSVYTAVQALMQLGRAVGDFSISDPSNFPDELPAPVPDQP